MLTLRPRRLGSALAVGIALALCGGATEAGALPLHTLTPAGCIEDATLSACGAGNQADGLDGAAGVAVSPDDGSVYVASISDSAIVRFNRAPDGSLTAAGCIGDAGGTHGCGAGNETEGLAGTRGVAVSPDGRSVYATSFTQSAIVRFNRAPDGALTPAGCIEDAGLSACGTGNQTPGLGGAQGVAVSPDGGSVYVAGQNDAAIVRFDRAADGSLSPAGCIEDQSLSNCGGGNQTDGLAMAVGVAVSPDGDSVYVASSTAFVRFNRNPNGSLTPAGCFEGTAGACGGGPNQTPGLTTPRGVAVSPDGASVYVAASGGNAIVRFNRAPDGALTPAGCIEDAGGAACGGGNQTPGLGGARVVTISQDGASVFTGAFGGDDAIVRFDRAADGSLTPSGCIERTGLSACGPGNQTHGLDDIRGLAVSSDGGSVFVPGEVGDTLTRINREVPPVCRGTAASGVPGAPQAVPLDCADPNGDPQTISVTSGPDNGTLGHVDQGSDTVAYTPNPGFSGVDAFSFRANADGKDSNLATATVVVQAAAGPTGPAGPAGPAGPPGPATEVTRLLALLGLDRYSVRTNRSLKARFSTSDAGRARLEIRKGSKVQTAVERNLSRGGTTSLTVRARNSSRRALRRGNYTLALRVTGADGQVATDSARLKVTK